MARMRTGGVVLALAAALGAGTVSAEDCGTGKAKITDANRKFSVELKKSSGMEDQSFDDIGCAVVSRNGECATRQGIFDGNAVVVDYLSGEAMPAEKAYFVLRTAIPTPRGYGIVAFKDKAHAEKFSREHGNGKIVKWFELVDEKLR